MFATISILKRQGTVPPCSVADTMRQWMQDAGRSGDSRAIAAFAACTDLPMAMPPAKAVPKRRNAWAEADGDAGAWTRRVVFRDTPTRESDGNPSPAAPSTPAPTTRWSAVQRPGEQKCETQRTQPRFTVTGVHRHRHWPAAARLWPPLATAPSKHKKKKTKWQSRACAWRERCDRGLACHMVHTQAEVAFFRRHGGRGRRSFKTRECENCRDHAAASCAFLHQEDDAWYYRQHAL